ncbi:MAG: hypothetical protein WEB58_15845 [Planctomycetaceae bacterium]
MARSNDEINKSQAIRDALRANRGKTPTEIAELLKANGVDVNPQYVSTIKSGMRKTSKAVRKARRGIQQVGRNSKLGGGNNVKNGLQVINAAVELLKVAGGMEEAKSALATVEEIGKAMP